MTTIRWGMIGCGSVTERKSGPAYQQVEGFALHGVFNRTLAKAEDYAARHGVPHVFASAEALIRSPEIDAVYIATPPDSHEAYALAVARAGAADGLVDRTIRRSPSDDREPARGVTQANVLVANVDVEHLVLAGVGHRLVVAGRVVDVAGIDCLLDAADPMHQARRPRLDPRTRTTLISLVGQQRAVRAIRLVEEFGRHPLEHVRVGHLPRFGCIRDVTVGQEHDRGHVLNRNAARFDRTFEHVGRAAGGDDGHGRVAVPAIDRLVQIALLGFGRKARGWPAPLRVDDDERQFGHDGKAHRLALQRDPGARRRRNAELPRIGRADRRADRGDLVFGLERRDVEFLEPRQVVQDRARRGDRVAAEEQRKPEEPRTRDKAQRHRLGTGDRPI